MSGGRGVQRKEGEAKAGEEDGVVHAPEGVVLVCALRMAVLRCCCPSQCPRCGEAETRRSKGRNMRATEDGSEKEAGRMLRAELGAYAMGIRKR